jgi:hypothetical protein
MMQRRKGVPPPTALGDVRCNPKESHYKSSTPKPRPVMSVVVVPHTSHCSKSGGEHRKTVIRHVSCLRCNKSTYYVGIRGPHSVANIRNINYV